MEGINIQENISGNDIIIEAILKTKKEIKSDKYPNDITCSFEYGNKIIELTYKPKSSEAITYIENVRPEKVSKKDQTSMLYTAVKIELEKLAENVKKEISYALRTENEKMKNWAETKGRELFNWNDKYEYPQKNYPTLYVFETTIRPKDDK